VSAPSQEHEDRRELLEAIAVLAGFSVRTRLGPGLEPDVVRVDLQRRRLFVADAKATEQPHESATSKRFERYVHEARRWSRAGFVVTLAICHGGDHRAAMWRDFLARQLPAGTFVHSAGLDATSVATWAVVPARLNPGSGQTCWPGDVVDALRGQFRLPLRLCRPTLGQPPVRCYQAARTMRATTLDCTVRTSSISRHLAA
jgi:hypothetical protein